MFLIFKKKSSLKEHHISLLFSVILKIAQRRYYLSAVFLQANYDCTHNAAVWWAQTGQRSWEAPVAHAGTS